MPLSRRRLSNMPSGCRLSVSAEKKTTPARGHEPGPSFIGCNGGTLHRSPLPSDSSNIGSQQTVLIEREANEDSTRSWKEAQMQETAHFKLRDWLSRLP